MINKKIAGILYAYGYMLQDKEGITWKIRECDEEGLTLNRGVICSWVSFNQIGKDYHILAFDYSDLKKEIPFEGKMIDPYLTLLAYRKTELDYEIIVDMRKNDFDVSRLSLLSHNVVYVMQTLRFSIGLPEGSWIPVTENNNPYK